jgi:glyoxylase-like metal-dependent hydrolase (beta-lactamase superfamily II)
MQAALQKVTIGNVEVMPIIDTAILMNPRHFLPQFADQFLAEYGDQADERGLFTMSITCFLVRSAGKTLLIDSGLGNRPRPGFPAGHLDESMRDAGIAPGDIDSVLNTHLHIDHVGWNTVDRPDGSREVFFPNARFVVQQAEWDFWMTAERMAEPGNAHLVECVEPLTNTGRIDFRTGESAFDENLTFIATPGHTPGHVAVGIYSAGERAIIIGDASHHPVQLDHPDWSPAFDVDPVQSAKTRDRLFDEAAGDGRTWIAGHWPYPGIGRIVRLDGRRVFQAL